MPKLFQYLDRHQCEDIDQHPNGAHGHVDVQQPHPFAASNVGDVFVANTLSKIKRSAQKMPSSWKGNSFSNHRNFLQVLSILSISTTVSRLFPHKRTRLPTNCAPVKLKHLKPRYHRFCYFVKDPAETNWWSSKTIKSA